MSPPRLRMFAGPNGSGKSTIKAKIAEINPNWLGVYINPDDIEREVAESGRLDFGHFNTRTTKPTIFKHLIASNQLIDNNYLRDVSALRFSDNELWFEDVQLNSYFVSAIADFLHARLVATRQSFSFETVMSHPSKIDLLNKALSRGFRNYLYYVATEDPEINISRVKTRVRAGGHDVARHKIKSRYYRSLDNLLPAIRSTNRAFIFDNSGAEAVLVAEVTGGRKIEIKNSNVPAWFKKHVLDKGT